MRDGTRWNVRLAPIDAIQDRWLILFETAETLDVFSIELLSDGGRPTDQQTQELLDQARRI